MSDYITLLPVMPFYRLYWEDGYTFDYSNDLEATTQQIADKSPGDVDGYMKFLDYAEEVFHEGYTKLAATPFLNFWSMIQVSPQLIRLQSYRSVYSIISKFIKDDHLRQVFSFHPLLVGGNPYTSSSIYTLIHYLERNWGVFFVKGGTGALVTALVKLFEELGGEIRLDSPVERIHTSNGRVTGVTTADGWHGDFDAVASNADVVHTYDALLGDNTDAQREAARLKSKRFSMSLFVAYFGVKRRHTQIAHHDILFGPRYKPHLNEIFNGPEVSDDFSLYLHAPTLTDPSVAPDGCEAFYVLSPVPHLGNAPVDWSEEGPRYRDKILDYLEKRYLPNLQADIETVRDHHPRSLQEHPQLAPRLGLLARTDPDPERLVQGPQPGQEDRRPLLRRRRDPPGGGGPRRGQLGQGDRGFDDRRSPRRERLRAGPMDHVVDHGQAVIEKGSKSFAAAAKLFDPDDPRPCLHALRLVPPL